MAVPSTDAQAEIDGLMAEFFRCVSFAVGGRPRYADIRALFITSGLLVKGTASGVEVTSLDEFIEPRQKSFDDGTLTQFRETELSSSTTVFGHAAHRESAYDKAGVSAGVAFAARGIIFTQFVWTRSGWLVSSMAWDDEREELSLDDRLVTFG